MSDKHELTEVQEVIAQAIERTQLVFDHYREQQERHAKAADRGHLERRINLLQTPRMRSAIGQGSGTLYV